MLQDRFGNTLSTTSTAARDAFVEGVDCILAVKAGGRDAFERAIAADDSFASAHLGLARTLQSMALPAEAKVALEAARAQLDQATERERSQVNALGLLIEGNAAGAYAAVREHLASYPRDALITQTCTGVYGLIGFSGQPGREADMLAFTSWLMPHYEDDWWFLSQHAFAQVEVGRIALAEGLINRALEIYPDSPQSAHVCAHVHYEAGEHGAGRDALKARAGRVDRAGSMHGHLSWHLALWALQEGDTDLVWHKMDQDIRPGASNAPPLFVLTDTASLLHRMALAGGDVPAERWRELAEYAVARFPQTGIAFVDVHAALANAMAGEMDHLSRIIETAKGPAADIVRPAAEAFRSIAGADWAAATRHLVTAMTDHARIGGSRAQRDLLELTMSVLLLRQGQTDEARRLLAIRRPALPADRVVEGL